MRICLMIEGQEGVTWAQWLALAQAAERHGFDALFRSDHYMPLGGVEPRAALDAWATVAGLAAVTSRIRLGTLVSPATFRHPAVLAKMAATVDHIAGGRVEVGMGAGWHEGEHAAFGFQFLPLRERFDAFAEQVEIVRGLWGDGPFTFHGRHHRMRGVDARPKPVQKRMPLILGGNALPRSAALAARFADEYNTVLADPAACRERRARVERACERAGRPMLAFSVMTTVLVAEDRAGLLRRAEALAARGVGGDPRALADSPPPAWVAGTVDDAAARLRALAEAGVDRVMLQHLLHDDLETVELIGRELIPRLGEPAAPAGA